MLTIMWLMRHAMLLSSITESYSARCVSSSLKRACIKKQSSTTTLNCWAFFEFRFAFTSRQSICFAIKVFSFLSTFTPIALKHFSPWLVLRKTENSEILVSRIWNLNLTWSNHRNYPPSKKKSSSINVNAGCKQILFSLGSNKKSPSLSRFFFFRARRVNLFFLNDQRTIFFIKVLKD